MRYRWLKFKVWLVKLLGGESTKIVRVPTLYSNRMMTKGDWIDLQSMPNTCPAFFRYVAKLIENEILKLRRIEPSTDNDRERLYSATKIDCLKAFYEIPDIATNFIENMEKKANYEKEMNALNNYGTIDKGESQ